jgi:DNA-binding transcriptional ArsR family regulator
MYRGWLSGAGPRVSMLKLELLTALVAGRHQPSFMTPTPAARWAVLPDELDAVAATPPATVRTQLDHSCRLRPMPAVLHPLYEEPTAHLPAVVEQMRAYWHVAVEPVWPRIRTLIAADLAYRTERFAVGGLAAVFDDLHPTVSLRHDRLLINSADEGDHRIALNGTGVMLIPSIYSWPTLSLSPSVRSDSADQPSLIYTPRGVAKLRWHASAEQAEGLHSLIGQTRARLLATLDLPITTTQLAQELNISAAAVSQHLKILKTSGLATAHRRGRTVLYQRTAAASALLTASEHNHLVDP